MVEIVKGLLFGLVLSFLIGPVFFALLQTSIEKGFKAGMFMAIGIALSDSMYIFISYTSISFFSDNVQVKFILGLLGSLIMMGFGITTFVKPVPRRGLAQSLSETNNYYRKILKGFLLNGINPFILLFWIGVAGLVTIEMEYSFDQASLFYVGVIAMVLATDITKAFLSQRLRNWMTPRFMKILNRSVGITLILFGVRILYYAFDIIGLI